MWKRTRGPRGWRGKRGEPGLEGAEGIEGHEGRPGTSAKPGDIPGWLLLIVKAIVPAYLLLAAGVIGAFWVQDHESDNRQTADHELVVEVAVETCEDRNLTKQAVRGTIDAAIQGDSSGGFDLTAIDGYENLPAATQAWVRNLTAALNRDGESPTRARLIAHRDSLIDEDCEAVRAEVTEQLADL